jgi:hypothetical protein
MACHHSPLLTVLILKQCIKSIMNKLQRCKNQVKAYEGNHYGSLSDIGLTWLMTMGGRKDRPGILGTLKPLVLFAPLQLKSPKNIFIKKWVQGRGGVIYTPHCAPLITVTPADEKRQAVVIFAL